MTSTPDSIQFRRREETSFTVPRAMGVGGYTGIGNEKVNEYNMKDWKPPQAWGKRDDEEAGWMQPQTISPSTPSTSKTFVYPRTPPPPPGIALPSRYQNQNPTTPRASASQSRSMGTSSHSSGSVGSSSIVSPHPYSNALQLQTVLDESDPLSPDSLAKSHAHLLSPVAPTSSLPLSSPSSPASYYLPPTSPRKDPNPHPQRQPYHQIRPAPIRRETEQSPTGSQSSFHALLANSEEGRETRSPKARGNHRDDWTGRSSNEGRI
jgi:hypothetical protein